MNIYHSYDAKPKHERKLLSVKKFTKVKTSKVLAKNWTCMNIKIKKTMKLISVMMLLVSSTVSSLTIIPLRNFGTNLKQKLGQHVKDQTTDFSANMDRTDKKSYLVIPPMIKMIARSRPKVQKQGPNELKDASAPYQNKKEKTDFQKCLSKINYKSINFCNHSRRGHKKFRKLKIKIAKCFLDNPMKSLLAYPKVAGKNSRYSALSTFRKIQKSRISEFWRA